jgi:osmotically inducible lipoprotein OsmB
MGSKVPLPVFFQGELSLSGACWTSDSQRRRNHMSAMNKIFVLSLCLMIAACGNTKGERALSGAGIGAGVGAVGSAVTGGSPWTGAAIGGAAGAATGALTNKNQINLDR